MIFYDMACMHFAPSVCVCVCVCAPAVCGLDGQQNHVRAFSRLCAFSCMHVRMRTNAWYASRPNKHKYARDACRRVCVRACVRACMRSRGYVCVHACVHAHMMMTRVILANVFVYYFVQAVTVRRRQGGSDVSMHVHAVRVKKARRFI
jgi:hypothetical protein